MPDIQLADRTAKIIAEARCRCRPIEIIGPRHGKSGLAAGYTVQDRLHALLAPQFGTVVGHKIGCTSTVMQQYLSMHEPCSGGIFERNVHRSGDTLPFDAYVRPGVECEIAVRLGADLPPFKIPHTRDTVVEAVAALMPAIEVVDDRFAGGWACAGPHLLIADDFFGAGAVLGDEIPASGVDMDLLEGRLSINGSELGRGTGSDLLGHPLNALAWLANNLISRGQHLRRGQLIMLGSVVQTMWVDRGDAVHVDFGGLGVSETVFH